MRILAFKESKTLTSNDIKNLSHRFGGQSDDYVEIVNQQQNIKTINKYPLLKEIDSAVNATK
ncbi:hypothetical protein H5079_12335 [Pseudoalteromonas sp. SG44-5]|uniref:BcsR/BcsP family cellulose biosynthesis protein n=1 Tax=Pseudoalteromonas sp. SG44-5 TaxID=2760960 RepID=UPI0015FAAA5B|nr:BcsR/BcsP family cellulose biosynthesis protein [Pseudoalteromonas sp. SG44-5]MBB1406396.1 hypothetical protein [Pseudoalteromonas sp. SG44-5]